MSELTIEASKIIIHLKERDIKLLKSLYDLKCLTCEQLFELHFSSHKNSNFCKKRLKFLVDNKVIEERIGSTFTTCYFLKTTGVNIVKYSYSMPNTVYDEFKNVLSRGYCTAGELKLKDKFINHQLHLNQFYIDLMKLNTQAYLNYNDSKHATKYKFVIPDGILDVYGVTFFIEMDMGTEQKKQINQKWSNYRDFINSEQYKYLERKIIILFILDGYGNQENRKKMVEGEAYTVLNSEIDNNFDIYVGNKKDILDTFKSRIIPVFSKGYIQHNEIKNIFINKYEYLIADGCKMSEKLFSGVEYLYIAKEDLSKCKLISSQNPMSFVVDEDLFTPFQTLNKICCFNDTNKTNAKLIIVCDSLRSMYFRLRQFDLLTQPNIYYTTIDRLKSKCYLNDALVNFDNLGNVYSFTDRDLTHTNYETTINL